MRVPSRPATLLLTAVLASACSSTVQVRSTVERGGAAGAFATGGTGDAAALSGTSGVATDQPSATGAIVGSTTSTGSSEAGGTAGTGVGTGSSVTAIVGGVPAKGKGWDAKRVYLGIIVATDAGAVLNGLGVSINPGDQLGDARAIVDEMNRSGGLFGRRVELLVKDDRYADAISKPVTTGAEDCAYFTQDHPVVAVINTTAVMDKPAFRACFAKARTPLVALSTAPFEDESTKAYVPYFYNALAVSWTRLGPVLVDRLKAQGYFGGWNATTGRPTPAAKAKVGVLYGNTDASLRLGPALVKRLQAAGYSTDSFEYASPGDMSSAVLRFASNGVTHVVTDGSAALFAVSAKSQNYLPRYGITSNDGVQALLETNVDHNQLRGAMGVGWYPSLDVDFAKDPGPGPGTASCLRALKAGGQTFNGKRFAQAFALAVCDGLRFAVFGAKAGKGLDPLSLRNGLVARGTSFPTGGSFASGLTATNFGMPGAARDLAFDEACSCFAYRGSTYALA